MTKQQDDKIKELQNELCKKGQTQQITWTESHAPGSSGFLFGEIKGVTVIVGPNGLVNIPAVRSYHPPRYPTPIVAAADADNLWARQERRDKAHPETARERQTGHLGSIVDPDLQCHNKACPLP